MIDPSASSPVAAVSLASFDRDPDAFAARLGSSFERSGFAIVSDHGIAAGPIARAETAARAFFALPEDAKRAYHAPGGGGARGYTPFGIEIAKGASAIDLKEFWHVGRELPTGHDFADVMPPNIWPAEVADFAKAMVDLYAAFETTGARLLAAIARHIGQQPDFFDDPVADGNSVLRLLHYPPIDRDGASIRAAPHEDINVITLLLGADEAGLEILGRDGEWLPVMPRADELVVNVGDMLRRLTNGRLRSTTHRVANPAGARRGVSRHSMPFFLHFRPDYRIETLRSCINADHPDRFPEPITAHAYLMQRLREIGLL